MGSKKRRNGQAGRILPVLIILSLLLSALQAAAAEVNFAYPKAATKKGLYITPGMEEDALELGIRHTTINLSAGDFLAGPGHQNDLHSYPFLYNGKTYWFTRAALAQYDRELGRLAQSNVLVTAILLLPKRADLEYLIYPAARRKNANYYQWDTTNQTALETLRAIVTFFQRRYSEKNGRRIVGWIVGNEVNNALDWNWCGEISLGKYVDLYAAECAEVYRAARSVYNNARIYMCLDHFWSVGGGSYWYSGRKFLKKFASRMKARGLGKGTWNIAYHPYNADLATTDIMKESPAVTGKADTQVITMKNLSVLTNFVEKNYTRKCRVILSEQGYSSVTAGQNSAAEQAGSVALAYYIAENNSMVDALILHRQVDHSVETAMGGAFGLYTTWGGENAAQKKLSWTAYRLADTTKTNKYTRKAASQAKQVTGKKVRKIYDSKGGKLEKTDSLTWEALFTEGAAGYGALSGIVWQDGTYRLAHDGSRNANVPWGILRRGKINCKSRNKLGFGIQVNGSTNGTCTVTVRLWAGSKRFFETRKKISCGAPHSLCLDLKDWKWRGKITRLDILVTPVGTGRWAEGANASISAIGIRK